MEAGHDHWRFDSGEMLSDLQPRVAGEVKCGVRVNTWLVRKEPDSCLHVWLAVIVFLQDRSCFVTWRLMTPRTFSTDREENCKSRDAPVEKAHRGR